MCLSIVGQISCWLCPFAAGAGLLDVCGPQDLGRRHDAPRTQRCWRLWPAAKLCGFLKYIVKEVVCACGRGQGGVLHGADGHFGDGLIAWAVIPFNDGWVLSEHQRRDPLCLRVSSLEVYGVIMGGWASNSKYPFLGSLALCGADDFL